MTKYEIITLGSAVVDAFLNLDLEEKEGNILLPTGCKLIAKELWFASGGGGTNTAIAFSRLGFKTAFLGKLGKDQNAKLILTELKKEKIPFLGRRGKEPTGYSVVVTSKKHNRTILTHKGANESLVFEKVKLRKIKTPWLYFSAMVGESLKTQEKLAHWAAKNNIKIAYNPSSYVTKTKDRRVKNILKNVEILILNKEEAQDLVGKNDLFEKLHRLGPKIVCITYGKEGNAVCDRRNIYITKPNKIKVKERTGAGDAFAAGFVADIIRFNDLKRAMQVGSLNAESVIQKPGAKNGLLSWEQIQKKLKRHPFKTERKTC